MAESVFQARSIQKHYRQTINATPNVIFPLLCPVREFEWLDGWDCKMIYSASGRVEEGAVFSTKNIGEAHTIWLVTRHDRTEHRVDFARFTPDSRTCILSIAVEPYGTERSHVDISITNTSIAQAGNKFLDGWTEDNFLQGVVFWEKSMNHFLKTHTKLSKLAETVHH